MGGRVELDLPVGGRGVEAVKKHKPDALGVQAEDGENGARIRPADSRPLSLRIVHAETIASRKKPVNMGRGRSCVRPGAALK